MIGVLSKGIDNWGHVSHLLSPSLVYLSPGFGELKFSVDIQLGGLLGGAGVSWLIGPAWSYQYQTKDGRLVFSDKAPLFSLIPKKSGH